MERLVEGTVGGVFRQTLQPAEIGKKLQKAMTGSKRVSVGTTIVPNEFVVKLHPKDFAQFADYSTALSRQMESYLAQVAGENRYTVVDRIRVNIREDESARRRSPEITATIKDSRGIREPATTRPAEPADRTAAFVVAREQAPSQTFQLSVISGAAQGTTFRIPNGSSTLGRSSDNAFVIDAPDVSRKHAKFEFSSGRLRVYDLNSTNGTRVNGEAVRISDLEHGDELTLGNQVLRVSMTTRRS
jgi:pSer/pThr/pTyr-binding forkhead associated (FHA) protein